MRIKLSDHFNNRRLLQYSYPTIVMLIFTSIYMVVDGLFVSNFAGKVSFAAVNLILPMVSVVSTLGFMVGTGGGAVVAMTLGARNKKKANEYFSLFVYTILVCGFIMSALCQIFLRQIVGALGAKEELFEYCVLYCRIILLSVPFFMLQIAFQVFFTTAEKPKLGLFVMVVSGVTNIGLDALLVGVLGYGLAGAAWATVVSELFGGIIPIIYFASRNNSLLSLCRTKVEFRVLGRACINGSSEMMNNMSTAIVMALYNFQLMKFAGSDGVATYGVLMYVNFIFVAVFIGFAVGTSPIISYHYGAQNSPEVKNVLRRSMMIIGIFAVVMFVLAEGSAGFMTKTFVGYDERLRKMTLEAFRLYAVVFLMSGFNIYASSFFTALGNGIVSGILALMRSLVFQAACVQLIPTVFGLHGVWMSPVISEICATAVTVYFLVEKRHVYHY